MKKTQLLLILNGLKTYVKYTLLYFGLSLLLDHYLFGKVLISDDIPATLVKSLFMGFIFMIIRMTRHEFAFESKKELTSTNSTERK